MFARSVTTSAKCKIQGNSTCGAKMLSNVYLLGEKNSDDNSEVSEEDFLNHPSPRNILSLSILPAALDKL